MECPPAVNPAHVGNEAQTSGVSSLDCIFGEGQMMSCANLDTCGISCTSFRISATFIKTFFFFLNASWNKM